MFFEISFLIFKIKIFQYSTLVEKYDRHGYKQRTRILILTDLRLYGLDFQTLKLRDRINNNFIESNLKENVLNLNIS